ncbi:MAG: hypothetical protein JWP85_1109 [Rhodoglobus sp.]|nr:hypothetical protein [Rhodoglobus sp.]
MSEPLPGEGGRAPKRFARFRSDALTAALLGLVSVATAFSSFAASEFDDRASSSAALAERTTIDAASAYQAAFIIYNRDLEVFSELVRTDPQLAAFDDPRTPAELDAAATTRDLLLYILGSPAFSSAYSEWVLAQREGSDRSVFDDPEYAAETYAEQAALLERAQELRAHAEADASLSDTMTHSTLVYAIALFLLGVAGVSRDRRIALGITAFGVAVFIVGLVLSVPVALQL